MWRPCYRIATLEQPDSDLPTPLVPAKAERNESARHRTATSPPDSNRTTRPAPEGASQPSPASTAVPLPGSKGAQTLGPDSVARDLKPGESVALSVRQLTSPQFPKPPRLPVVSDLDELEELEDGWED